VVGEVRKRVRKKKESAKKKKKRKSCETESRPVVTAKGPQKQGGEKKVQLRGKESWFDGGREKNAHFGVDHLVNRKGGKKIEKNCQEHLKKRDPLRRRGHQADRGRGEGWFTGLTAGKKRTMSYILEAKGQGGKKGGLGKGKRGGLGEKSPKIFTSCIISRGSRRKRKDYEESEGNQSTGEVKKSIPQEGWLLVGGVTKIQEMAEEKKRERNSGLRKPTSRNRGRAYRGRCESSRAKNKGTPKVSLK